MDIWCIQELFYINLPILRRWNHRAKQFFNCQWNHAGVKTVDVFCFFGWWENPSPKKYAEKSRFEVGETREFFSYTKLIPFQLCYIYNELLRQSNGVSHHITPPKINMEPESEGFNRNLFQGFIFTFHVNFRGCNDLDNFMGNPGNQDFLRKPATNSTLWSICSLQVNETGGFNYTYLQVKGRGDFWWSDDKEPLF